MKSPVRRLVPHLCAIPLSLLLWAPGCAKQGEGERCDYIRSGQQDCETPLVCVPATELVDDSVDRCCPAEGQTVTDDRCLRNDSSGGTGGKDGGSGGSDSGSGGSDSGSGGSDSGSGGTDSGSGGTDSGSGGTDSGSGGSGGAAGSASGGTGGGDSGADSASGGTTSDAGAG